MALADLLQNMNPAQQMMFLQMLRGQMGGGTPQGGMGMPGAAPPIAPQTALLAQRLAQPPSTMEQVLQQLAAVQQGQQQLQQGQQQTLGAISQPNPLLAQLSPQVAAMFKMLSGGSAMPPGTLQPQSSGVGTA